MRETLHQPPPNSFVRLPQRHRNSADTQLGLSCLLLLLAVGLGLLAWRTLSESPLAGTQEEGARAARDNPPRNEVTSPPKSLREILAQADVIPTHHHPLLGQRAPDIHLADTKGKVWTLRELQDGRPVVLIFYYGYHCVGCVRQLFDIHRDLPLFRDIGGRVVAISADPPELTRQRLEQNGPFGFPVLSDPGNQVAQAYHVFQPAQPGTLPAGRRHGTFILDREGNLQWVNVGDAPFRRLPALLYQLARIGGTLP